MWIRVSVDPGDLRLEKGEHIELRCDAELDALVTIDSDGATGKFTCSAVGKSTPPAKIAGELARANPQEKAIVDDYLRGVARQLTDQLTRTTRLLMWRRGHDFAYRRPALRGASWSSDGHQWNAIKGLRGFQVSIETIPRGPVPKEVLSDVSTMVAAGHDEPLARQILREAWNQRSGSPRSALVLAIAAAEIGFKQCVSVLVPKARWLVENLPSPPLDRMLKEYLPLLPVKATLTGKTIVPPDELLQEIKTGVVLRNKVSHVGDAKISLEKLDRILEAVSDLLWILDIYQGHVWAIENARPEVLGSWKAISK